MPSERACLFIDGSNWHHGLKRIVNVSSRKLDYRSVAAKLVLGRELVGIRYYVGEVSGDIRRNRGQQHFLKLLKRQCVDVSLGRIEKNKIHHDNNPLVMDIRKLLNDFESHIPKEIKQKIIALCDAPMYEYHEKQVDVHLAVDLLSKAHRDEYDVAYLLSADGDFVPAVNESRSLGKKVFAVGPSVGYELRKAVNCSIRTDKKWWGDSSLYLD